ncbi:DUF3788 domain-containing protein [Listeria seeligeri]|uniref:DUF3788 domain-containing protein n=1 Tax=Listeria seeligeri TaxID=1640 RepID=UPI001886EBCB|nr:DUF3788 domain-containing protein [Listeria seeligeri]MBF2541759.1 DUF3788 domain-containing protein [Listeria seeligeri]
MEWYQSAGAGQQPTEKQIANFVGNPLWAFANDYLRRAYLVKPQYNYSCCSMRPGWNIRYAKNGKTLCTFYPMSGYFSMLVVIGSKEIAEAELMMSMLSKYVSNVFSETAAGHGAKWLMLDIQSKDTLLDALKLVSLRVKPKNKIEMGL